MYVLISLGDLPLYIVYDIYIYYYIYNGSYHVQVWVVVPECVHIGMILECSLSEIHNDTQPDGLHMVALPTCRNR